MRITNSVTGRQDDKSSWIKVGEDYLVLAVSMKTNGTSLRLLTEDASAKRMGLERVRAVGLWDAADFRTVDGAIPRNWRCAVNEGSVEFAPDSWLRKEFWVDYFDDVPAALQDLDAELSTMLAEN